ncbi:MAG: hypothetical protein HY460_02265 [Parcubacteria group bacterium]|nr:hypothetical protein [Parcubacteria group bacterium]
MDERVHTLWREHKGDIAWGVGVFVLLFIAFAAGTITSGSRASIVIDYEKVTTGAALLQTLEHPVQSPEDENLPFVASTNGTVYHWKNSPWAERIKKENRIYFATEEEARAAGYRRSKDFEKYAPKSE